MNELELPVFPGVEADDCEEPPAPIVTGTVDDAFTVITFAPPAPPPAELPFPQPPPPPPPPATTKASTTLVPD
jgi:hypothetical protein